MTVHTIVSALRAAALSGVLAAGGAAANEPLRLGGLALDYDPGSWRLARSTADEAVLEPRGGLEGEQDPVRFVRRPGDVEQVCRALAHETWAGDLYGDPDPTPTDLAGHPALRLAVHTRCRNATPVGHIACVEAGGTVYAVMTVNAIVSCRADIPVLFPDPAPLDELLRSLRIEP